MGGFHTSLEMSWFRFGVDVNMVKMWPRDRHVKMWPLYGHVKMWARQEKMWTLDRHVKMWPLYRHMKMWELIVKRRCGHVIVTWKYGHVIVTWGWGRVVVTWICGHVILTATTSTLKMWVSIFTESFVRSYKYTRCHIQILTMLIKMYYLRLNNGGASFGTQAVHTLAWGFRSYLLSSQVKDGTVLAPTQSEIHSGGNGSGTELSLRIAVFPSVELHQFYVFIFGDLSSALYNMTASLIEKGHKGKGRPQHAKQALTESRSIVYT